MITLENSIDPRGLATFGIPLSDSSWDAELLADTDTVLAVPADARFAIFSAEDHFYISESALTLPATAAFINNDIELNPTVRNVEGIASLHFRATNLTRITVSFYR